MSEFEQYIQYLHKEVNEEKNISIAAMKKRTLNICETYFAASEGFINKLQWEQLEMMDEIHRLKNTIHSLEAILLIHGVNDFPMWQQKGSDYLVDVVLELNEKKQMQKPTMMIENNK